MMSAKGTVLVVYSQEMIASLVRMVLEKQGYQVISVQSGKEANAKLDAFAIDVVLMDVARPDLAGVAAIQRVRRYSQAPIIMLSSMSHQTGTRHAIQAGAAVYIVIPFSAEALLKAIRKLVPDN